MRLRDLPRHRIRFGFEAAANAGITAFIFGLAIQRARIEAYLEVDSSGEQRMIAITISGGDEDRISRMVSIAPREKYRETFDLSNSTAGSPSIDSFKR
jgi:hypothetical protein